VTPITFAHRGARTELPENTVAAFVRATELGARGLETDARLSADGHPVLVHDAAVRRGLRRIRVATASAAALAEVSVPTLDDLYATVGTQYELSVDLKAEAVEGPILDVAKARGAVERLWLCSPSVSRLTAIRARSAHVRLVHSTTRRAVDRSLERYAATLAAARIDAVNLQCREWTAGMVELFHRFGLRVFAWDAQEVRHIRAALAMHMDGIYSDHVDRLVATVAEFTDE
jgi:glycerophosphoryl diester phosphodiesterase